MDHDPQDLQVEVLDPQPKAIRDEGERVVTPMPRNRRAISSRVRTRVASVGAQRMAPVYAGAERLGITVPSRSRGTGRRDAS